MKEKKDTKNKQKKGTVKNGQTTQKKKDVVQIEESLFKRYFTKENITYFIILLLDILLVIYSARRNIVNYITILDEDIFVSKFRYLIWGRNYINLIIIVFFYFYICLVNKFFLKKKNTKKFLILLLVILGILNITLFFIFTKRVY